MSKLNPEYKKWRSELRKLAREAKLTWLLGDGDFEEQWADGETPEEVMQAIYDDAQGRCE